MRVVRRLRTKAAAAVRGPRSRACDAESRAGPLPRRRRAGDGAAGGRLRGRLARAPARRPRPRSRRAPEAAAADARVRRPPGGRRLPLACDAPQLGRDAPVRVLPPEVAVWWR